MRFKISDHVHFKDPKNGKKYNYSGEEMEIACYAPNGNGYLCGWGYSSAWLDESEIEKVEE